jgi:UDP-N-acetylmuramate dehydrogenase
MESSSYNILIKYLQENSINFAKNYDLSNRSFINAGGIAKFFVEPANKLELIKFMSFIYEYNIPYLIIGNLSNTLFRDGLINTVIVSTKNLNNTKYNESIVEAEAGVLLPQLAHKLTKSGYEGFAGLSGFPATIGGAIYMNASCYDFCISNHLIYVEILNQNGKIEKWNKDKFKFKWRYSVLHDLNNKIIILSATFQLKKGNFEELQKQLSYIKLNRLKFQEHNNPNLGSVFATRNIYKEISKKNFLYFFIYYGFIFFSKIFLKKSPVKHAIVLNKLTQSFFGLSSKKIKFSKYTFNCLTNSEKNSANEIISFIKLIQKKINYCVNIEIIIYESII